MDPETWNKLTAAQKLEYAYERNRQACAVCTCSRCERPLFSYARPELLAQLEYAPRICVWCRIEQADFQRFKRCFSAKGAVLV